MSQVRAEITACPAGPDPEVAEMDDHRPGLAGQERAGLPDDMQRPPGVPVPVSRDDNPAKPLIQM